MADTALREALDARKAARQTALSAALAQRRDALHANDVAVETERALAEQPRITVTPPASDTFFGWMNRIGRVASLGLSDVATAALVQRNMRGQVPDLTFREALGAVKSGQAADPNVAAEVIGSIVPGVGLARAAATVGTRAAIMGGSMLGAAKEVAQEDADALDIAKGAVQGAALGAVLPAATRMGMTRGATSWALRHPVLRRLMGAAAGGAAGGFIEEGVRVGISETVDAAAGRGFSPQAIEDAALQGMFVGAIASPALVGAGGLLKGVANTLGLPIGQARAATDRIIRAAAREGEGYDDVVTRLSTEARRIAQETGSLPTLAELLPEERVRDLTAVVRHYSGLGDNVVRLTNQQLRTVLTDFDKALGRGVLDTGQIEAAADAQFGAVMDQYGRTMVNVSDDVLDVLAENKAWLKAHGRNDAADAMLRITTAREGIAALEEKMTRLSERAGVANAAEEVADIRRAVALLIDDQAVEAGEEGADAVLAAYRSGDPGDSIARLVQLANHLQAVAVRAPQASAAARQANANVANLQPTLAAMRAVLRDYRTNGLKVSLSDANDLRKAATAAVRMYARGDKPEMLAVAREMNAALGTVGTTEVPEYAMAIRNFAKAMRQIEGQDLGVAAITGAESPANVAVSRRTGLQFNANMRVRAGDMPDFRRGIAEGGTKELRRQLGQAPGAASRAVETLATSPNAQAGVRAAMPAQARRALAAATRASDRIATLRAAGGNVSKDALQEELATAHDLLEAGIIAAPGTGIGGAAMAGLMSRALMKVKIPRGTATKLVNMLLDPAQMDDALRYMQKKEIRLGPFLGALSANLATREPQ